jgi:hypothetical protein
VIAYISFVGSSQIIANNFITYQKKKKKKIANNFINWKIHPKRRDMNFSNFPIIRVVGEINLKRSIHKCSDISSIESEKTQKDHCIV